VRPSGTAARGERSFAERTRTIRVGKGLIAPFGFHFAALPVRLDPGSVAAGNTVAAREGSMCAIVQALSA
jgi:hypothetical protein